MQKLKVTEMGRLSVDSFKAAEKLPLTIVLDNIRSLYNVGSIFRTSDAFRVERIILCGITGRPPSIEIHKTALGAEDSVEWSYERSTLDTVKRLNDEGYVTMAVEQVHDSVKLNNWTPNTNKRYALVLGNEVKGVDQEVVDLCQTSLEIPQFGTKHSLNVANTAAIVIWHFAFVHMSQDGSPLPF